MVLLASRLWGVLDAREQSNNIEGSPMELARIPQAMQVKEQPRVGSKQIISEPVPKPLVIPKMKNAPRVLAIVFPQYHQDPLNDRLWGKGFTDWDNLRAAPKENRLGFEIPRPTELGYYDLTNQTVRKMQGDLAKEYDIDGFIFHHYWFYDPSHPGPTLQAPLTEMLKDGHPDVPFLLNWCDGSWVDTWLGKSNASQSSGTGNNVLQEQFFPQETDASIKKHYEWLKPFFLHPNYIKVRGQPVFMIHLRKPSSYGILKQLRLLADKDGLGIFFMMGMSHSHAGLFPEGIGEGQRRDRFPGYIVNKTVAYPNPYDWLEGQVLKIPEWCTVENPVLPKDHRREVVGILTSFDNTPRRNFDSAHLWSADRPEIVVERFYVNLYAAIHYETCCLVEEKAKDLRDGEGIDDSFIIINSMNEWAEGMSLEPSTVFGRQLLDVVRRAKYDVYASGCNPKLVKLVKN